MTDDRRQQLADVLTTHMMRSETLPNGNIRVSFPGIEAVTSALLPLIDRVAAEAAAEALMTAFREDRTTVARLSTVEQLTCFLVKAEDLVDRAAQLRAAPTVTDHQEK